MAALTTDFPFAKDLQDFHLVYDYNVHDAQGNPEKWRYEIWFFSEYTRSTEVRWPAGPISKHVASNASDQASYGNAIGSKLLPAETGTVVSLVYDIANRRITTLIAFSKGTCCSLGNSGFGPSDRMLKKAIQGHWDNPEAAHGDKRNPADFERWRGLARMGIQTDRHMLPEQADIVDVFRGKGGLEPIEQSWPTL
ncbi:hypothetical protein IMSHALPRED_009014 [Imshaugia aleurites]|uniref:Uncharacterized protein n=1 Tax=Imshaugia aleurites TaxID=172621 RepID=A0A8H3G161_9LECA|nr:hypothetical protein IMSHALPRED_009014 [Imshaugia aleurites]